MTCIRSELLHTGAWAVGLLEHTRLFEYLHTNGFIAAARLIASETLAHDHSSADSRVQSGHAEDGEYLPEMLIAHCRGREGLAVSVAGARLSRGVCVPWFRGKYRHARYGAPDPLRFIR